MAKTTTEKITNLEEQIQQLENQRKQLVQKQKEENRKARTKRLIERGAILESLISNPETLTNDQIKTILVQALCATQPSVQTQKSVKPPSGANGGRSWERATFGD